MPVCWVNPDSFLGAFLSTLYVHYSWFIFLLAAVILSFLVTFYTLYLSEFYFLSFSLFDTFSSGLDISFYLDFISLSFMTVVLLISCVIMFYSYNYISPYSNSGYFLWLTILFVLSMLLVVTMNNLFFTMLGWDGLGLVSFFLIVYYQNNSSITSGVFTLLINRVGDCFFLVTLVLLFFTLGDFRFSSFDLPTFSVVLFLILTFITKSAIYPFSPWLPLAMAAPTPISALVHSSTLVTAGLFLIMRYSYILYSNPQLIYILSVLCLFTSFYAGINAIFETDLNNLIALSTLSHLGFIGLAFSLGLINLAFFHMLTHALFNSLLFMTMGDIIININHAQDIRYLSSGIRYTPFSCIIMYVSLFNLLGLPSLSGFFSNDLVLEMSYYTSSSYLLISILLVNIVFTYYYTLQLFYYSFQYNNVVPFQMFHSTTITHALLLFGMALSTLGMGLVYLSYIFPFAIYYSVPSALNFYPIILSALILLCLAVFESQLKVRNRLVHYYFSTMMFLSTIMITLTSNLYFYSLLPIVRSLEWGSLNYLVNVSLSSTLSVVSLSSTQVSMISPLKVAWFSLAVLITLLYLL